MTARAAQGRSNLANGIVLVDDGRQMLQGQLAKLRFRKRLQELAPALVGPQIQ